MNTEPSKIRVSLVDGESRITESRGIAPLKLLFPKNSRNFATVIMSNYGGGYVEGDVIELDIKCEKNSRGYIGSQALTRIYKSEENKACIQNITGKIEGDALMVFYPDPAVPQQGSVFQQSQDWHLEDEGLLIVFDGLSAGRISREEKFAYSNYQSKISVFKKDKIFLHENFNSDPSVFIPATQGNFGEYLFCGNLFVVGDEQEKKFTDFTGRLETSLDAFNRKNQVDTKQKILCTCDRPKNGVLLVRMLTRTLEGSQQLHQLIHDEMVAGDLLDVNLRDRKF